MGVALVASAAKSMATKLCAGWLRACICTAAVVLSYYWPQAYTFPACIIAGGLVTLAWSWWRKEPVPQDTVRAALGCDPALIRLGCGRSRSARPRCGPQTRPPAAWSLTPQ